jgi:pimeloyl-ACP methyl ester carboxylesterase
MTSWAGQSSGYPSAQDVHRYAGGMSLPFVAHSAAEYYRWIGRNQIRWDGPVFNKRVGVPIDVPVLHLQGAEDGCVLPAAAAGSDRFVRGRYTYWEIERAGHFLTEEAPDRVNRLLLDWLAALPR